jgi:hypothetical protein
MEAMRIHSGTGRSEVAWPAAWTCPVVTEIAVRAVIAASAIAPAIAGLILSSQSSRDRIAGLGVCVL